MGAAGSKAGGSAGGGSSVRYDAGFPWANVSNDFELAVRSNKALCGRLKRALGADGDGLHDCVSSVQGRLGEALVRDLRYVATLRNKLVHEEGFDRLPDRGAFVERLRRGEAALDQVEAALSSSSATRAGGKASGGEDTGGCVIC